VVVAAAAIRLDQEADAVAAAVYLHRRLAPVLAAAAAPDLRQCAVGDPEVDHLRPAAPIENARAVLRAATLDAAGVAPCLARTTTATGETMIKARAPVADRGSGDSVLILRRLPRNPDDSNVMVVVNQYMFPQDNDTLLTNY